MVRRVLGAIAGYIVFFLCLLVSFLSLYFAMGSDRAFLPGKYDPTMLWTISAFILGFIAAAIGGYIAALIAKSGAVKIMVGLMVVIGAMSVVGLMIKNKPEEIRTGNVTSTEEMMKAREPVWVAVVNPILGVIGIFAGASLRKNKDS
jgi:hypothetical protein